MTLTITDLALVFAVSFLASLAVWGIAMWWCGRDDIKWNSADDIDAESQRAFWSEVSDRGKDEEGRIG